MNKIKIFALFYAMLNLTKPLFASDFKHEEVYGAYLKLDHFDFRYVRKSDDYAGFKFDASKLGTGFPLRFYVGNLNFSKAISRLKSPSYSSAINPLSTNCIFYDETAVSLPSKSSASKTLSTAICYKDAVSVLEFIADENEALSVTLSRDFEDCDYIKLSAALTWMSFFLEPKVQNSWKLSSPFFTGFRANAFYGEFLVKIPLVNTKIGIGAVENPFNTVRFFSTLEADIHYGPFSLSSRAFASDNLFLARKEAFLTPSSKSERHVLEINVNPKLRFYEKGFSFEAGLAGFYDCSILSEGYNPELSEKISAGAAARMGFGKNSIYLLYKMQNITEDDVKHGATVKYTHDFKKLKLGFSSNTVFTQNKDPKKSTVTETALIYVYPHDFPITYGSVSVCSEFKDSRVRTKANMSASGEIMAKKVKFLAKLTVSTVLEVE